LSEYRGKVLLIVNVASKCGLTPQYAGLEALYRRLCPAGLEVLGFPCNDFGAQEPGAEDEIAAFCNANYGVSFPLFAKVNANSAPRHPLYGALIAACPQALGVAVHRPWRRADVGRAGGVRAAARADAVPGPRRPLEGRRAAAAIGNPSGAITTRHFPAPGRRPRVRRPQGDPMSMTTRMPAQVDAATRDPLPQALAETLAAAFGPRFTTNRVVCLQHGTDESARFVNGVLAAAAEELRGG
jgi:glutathione peroxidase-family protein